MRCVLPRKCLDGENETIKFCKGYRPCRQSGDGTCVHCRAAAAYLSQARRSATDGDKQWGGKRKRTAASFNSDSYVHELPFRGFAGFKKKRKVAGGEEPMPVPNAFDIIPEQLLAEIDLGPRSTVYRPKLDAYVEERKREEAILRELMHGGRTEAREKDGNSSNYLLNIEAILGIEAACGCTWDVPSQAWSNRCTECKAIKCYYLYDRGITKEFAFHKCGVTCITPYYKGKEQTCFGAVHMTDSKAVATERIPVEQANRCLRCFDGFHSVCPTNRLYLASAEGQCARGLTNLQPTLNDWAQNSVCSLAETTDESAADDSGEESDSPDNDS